ncbi:MAG: polysaccharide biosynthesis tyrosine autokinase [Schaedlerella sp.]|nr:polysaccharide biosynthesis tyrosine autokinase [Schaedlerella sp.]
MDEYRRNSGRTSGTVPEKIDITDTVQNFYQAVKKLWWIVLILTIVFMVKEYFTSSSSYVPQYTASATVSVSSNSGSSAEDLANLFPYMIENGVLDEVIAEDMGTNGIPGSINIVADDGTNFLTLSATATDPEVAYELLQSTMDNYPEVVRFVFGEVKFYVLDETGIPEEIGRQEVIRGSYKRGALKGFGIGCLIIIFYVLSRTTVKSKEQLKKQLNLMECGSIPHIREKKRRKETFNNSLNILNERVSQNYVEAIRKTRVKLLRKMEEKKYKSLLVTSSIAGEGKTTLAVNLAISMAQQGKRVILLDCDLRNPSVAGVMNKTVEKSAVLDVLNAKTSVKKVLENVEIQGGELKVLYGMKDDDANINLMRYERMEELIQYCQMKADIVIIDTAPSSFMADAAYLAKYVDAAVYVVRHDYTKLRQIREGIQTLSMSGVHLIGYIYNDAVTSNDRYGYNRGGYYGYHGYDSSYKVERDDKADSFGRVFKE